MAMPPPDSFITGAPPPGEFSAEAVPGLDQHEFGPEALERLRELRAEVQDLHNLLLNVSKGQITLKTYTPYIHKTRDDISALIAQISDGDTIRHLHNLWEQIINCPLMLEPDGDYSAQEQMHYLNLLDEQFKKILFLVGNLTIPARLNDWLAKARPGYYVPFHLVFEDELPDPEDRQRVLNYLAWAPEVIHQGIVDANTGLIYRYAKDARERLLSILLLTLGFLVATGLVIGAAYLPVANWPFQPQNLGTMLFGWGALLAGMLIHVAVGTVKRRQAQGELPQVVSLADLPFVLNARAGQFLVKLLLALFGFFGLAFAVGIQEVTLLNTFLVGYSLDSFVELFGASVEQRAAAQMASLKQQMGIKNP